MNRNVIAVILILQLTLCFIFIYYNSIVVLFTMLTNKLNGVDHMTKQISQAAIIGCSDGTSQDSDEIIILQDFLQERFMISSWIYPTLYCTSLGETQSPQMRAQMLYEAFLDEKMDAVFDVSGGDAVNGILSLVDFSVLRKFQKPYFGYSDNSVLLNPLRQISRLPVYYFQPRFLPQSTIAQDYFAAVFENHPETNVPRKYTFLQGDVLTGEIVGGNIRCTLKLIGTPWQPNFNEKVLLLESNSGNLSRIETMLWQYKHIGAFSQCSGVLLGNFTEIAQNGQMLQLYMLVQQIIDNPDLPIVHTKEIGHQIDSLCLPFHIPICLCRDIHI